MTSVQSDMDSLLTSTSGSTKGDDARAIRLEALKADVFEFGRRVLEHMEQEELHFVTPVVRKVRGTSIVTAVRVCLFHRPRPLIDCAARFSGALIRREGTRGLHGGFLSRGVGRVCTPPPVRSRCGISTQTKLVRCITYTKSEELLIVAPATRTATTLVLRE